MPSKCRLDSVGSTHSAPEGNQRRYSNNRPPLPPEAHWGSPRNGTPTRRELPAHTSGPCSLRGRGNELDQSTPDDQQAWTTGQLADCELGKASLPSPPRQAATADGDRQGPRTNPLNDQNPSDAPWFLPLEASAHHWEYHALPTSAGDQSEGRIQPGATALDSATATDRGQPNEKLANRQRPGSEPNAAQPRDRPIGEAVSTPSQSVSTAENCAPTPLWESPAPWRQGEVWSREWK